MLYVCEAVAALQERHGLPPRIHRSCRSSWHYAVAAEDWKMKQQRVVAEKESVLDACYSVDAGVADDPREAAAAKTTLS